jgi:nicotinamide phosphoribosyltransferase
LSAILDLLFDKFGFSINTKGYNVLPPQVRVIQADAIDLSSILAIYESLKAQKISAADLVVGMVEHFRKK